MRTLLYTCYSVLTIQNYLYLVMTHITQNPSSPPPPPHLVQHCCLLVVLKVVGKIDKRKQEATKHLLPLALEHVPQLHVLPLLQPIQLLHLQFLVQVEPLDVGGDDPSKVEVKSSIDSMYKINLAVIEGFWCDGDSDVED